MAKKQMVNAFIEPETYLALKAQNANVSKLIRDALRFAVSNDITEEEKELEKAIDRSREIISTESKILSENSMKLAMIKERNEKKDKESLQEAVDLVESIKQGGYMNDF